MNKSMKQSLLLITFGVLLFAAVMNLNSVVAFLSHIAAMLLPVGIGLLCAFILNVPMSGIEKGIDRLFAKVGHKPHGKGLHLISLLLTLLAVAAILVALITMVIPQAVKTVESVVALVEQHWPEWIAFLKDKGVDTSLLATWQEQFDLRQLLKEFGSSAKLLAGSIAGAASATVSALTSALFGVVIAVYVLLDKDTLAQQAKKLLYANLKTAAADRICSVAGLVNATYAKFFSGQCLEALILGVLMLIVFLIFHLPYAGLVGMATAVCALVPYIGALVSCVLAVVLSLLVSPAKALICLIVYLSVQFVENQFIYPHVVGGSVGLSPLWTLVAVIIGGKLFGLVGMILFIPLTAVVYELIRRDTNRKLAAKPEGAADPPAHEGD